MRNQDKPLRLKEKKQDNNTFFFNFKIFKPILLSHHPSCKKFETHTFKIRNHRFCIGCFIGYPTAVTFIIFFFIIDIKKILGPFILLIIALSLLSSFFLSVIGLTKFKPVKILQKISIGLGASFLFWGIWSFPNPFLLNLISFLIIFGILMSLLNGYHFYGLYSKCKKCQYSLKWKICPGFEDFREYLKKNNYPNVFS